ncbi:manganese catalase family protein [Candidatus Mycobacterium methanotrophicum]|uniref:Manganese catalase family protein n=1 Tax=Candidatus Mycobacterium methanotrophicum TaxID=2943498 RepID=A0ABY4QIT8_9MYCO|nr:manganese catalase family protein [Candidatus Mycobacterium methanotrophicum]UQX10932.1 manganese catalase family protein [Candidatus Mycobacterium methanotrophicum]
MFLHNKKLMYTVRVDEPDPAFAKLLLEQFGGPNGELAAAMRYFLQGWNEPDGARRSMLLDIATEELSHLEMVAQTLSLLLKGSPSELVDQVEGSYLGELLDGDMPTAADIALNSGANILGGGGARLTDSQGTPFTAAYIDTLGEPASDLRSDIAAEARAKIVYERLIKLTDDAGAKDTLTFLMTREIAHQKMFEAALAAIESSFPPGTLPGNEKLGHAYFADSGDFGGGGENGAGATQGFGLAESHTTWGFTLDDKPAEQAARQEVL